MIPSEPHSHLLDLTTVAQGTQGGPQVATNEVIRDAASFARVFGADLPKVSIDWDTEVVTVVALGQRGHTGYSVTIESIEFFDIGIRGGSVDVWYRERAGSGGRAVSYPFHAVKSSRFGQALFWQLDDESLPTAVFGDWRGPIGEPVDGVDRYVPRAEAKLSRSVAGFVIDPEGGFTKVDDAPGDGAVEVRGRWTATGNVISVKLDDGRELRYELLSAQEHELRIRRSESA